MKNCVRTMVVVALALVIASPAAAADNQKKKRNKKDGQPQQISAVMKKLEAVDLTQEQSAKIKELAATYSAKIAESQKALGEGAKKVAQARKNATAEGKKGKELQAAIAADLTPEQKAAWTAIQSTANDFRAQVVSVLTPEQAAKVDLRVAKKRR